MLKKILGLAFLVTGFWLVVILVYAADETLTITTYYPSPYGSYREVSAYQMKIGKDYSDASYSVNENNLIVQGNVGIGTASPNPVEKLVQTGNIRMRSSDSRIIAFNSDSGYSLGYSGGAAIRFIADGSNDEIAFETHKTGVSHAERVRINSLGNLGIGTASPAQTLDVAGNMQANLYYDKENTAYYVDPNATSNVYRMYVNYSPTAANDVITKQYADANYKDPPGQWTCTVRYGSWITYGSGCNPRSTAYCSGNEKVISGGVDANNTGTTSNGGGPVDPNGWTVYDAGVCNWGGQIRAAAYCCQ